MIAEPFASDPAFMEKHKAAMRRVEMAQAQARSLLRTFGPGRTVADDVANNPAIRYCRKCTPEVVLHECPLCNWQTDQRWRFKLHLDTYPKWCADRAAKKARAWASKV